MVALPASLPRERVALGTFLFAAAMIWAGALIALRRPDQIMNPEVWNEDGIFVIPQIIQGGFFSIFEPVNGYLIIPSRMITWLSLQGPLEYYPTISTALGVFAQAACVAAVAVAPTMLRWPALCAALMVFLPMDPEVYVLPQYTFWWTTTLLFLALIWTPAAAPIWRNVFIVIGGFSSPMAIVLLPLFGLRLAYTRAREDAIALAVVAAVSIVQLYFILLGDPAQTESFALADVLPTISVFFAGWTAFAAHPHALWLGLGVCVVLASGLAVLPREDQFYYLLTGLMVWAAIASAVLRAPIEIMSPVGNGPRYFFLPLVLMAWMLVWLLASRKAIAMTASAAVLLTAVPVTWTHYQRGQEGLQPWVEAVQACRQGGHEMPVHHNGQSVHQHLVPYDQSWCGR
ncbi:hypothetical protein [Aliihoeflea sp. 40Bstr573]|uniref:hypothetical protein n=1 Tax=Aliihoeflea sp. 40Bstr573 TaxID=2696467 RepID=UPI002095498E|nr:hypothetical protein [Aliihoeflea sp. 40Bstr573]MCO6386053.1 hypothetical protein [Aliihoeflea sp. 40Bstr573]